MKNLRPHLAVLSVLLLLVSCGLIDPVPRVTVGGLIIRENGDGRRFSAQAVQSLAPAPGQLLVGLSDNAGRLGTLSAESFESLALDVTDRGGDTQLRRVLPGLGVALVATNDMRAAATRLARDPDVRYVEPDREMIRLGDEFRGEQWALDIVDVDQAWPRSRGESVRVAIIDGGFQPGHPDLVDNEGFRYNFRYESSNVQANPMCESHGEHVAGIIGATADNDIGIAGVAPLVELQFLDVSGNESSGDCSILLSSLLAALEWAAGDGASSRRSDVINISLGTPEFSPSLWDATFEAFSAGIVIVAAAGNSPFSQVMFPAAHPEVLAVSATGPEDVIASYSTTGPEVFVSAPGGDGASTPASITSPRTILSTIYRPDSGYAYDYMEGTSMASPMAAGVAALVRAVDSRYSPLDVANIVAASSHDLGRSGWDSIYGHGRVDAAAAVALAEMTAPVEVPYRLSSNRGHVIGVPFHGEFELANVAVGELTLTVESDDNGNGVFGEIGEYRGTTTFEIEEENGEYLLVPVYRR